MPIKPENKHLYPRDWMAIREEVLRRAENQCERCGVPNHAWGWRDREGEFHMDFMCRDLRIVLTIAHLDHNPDNNGIPGVRPNLAALCQKCHNQHDAPHRRANAARTRFEADRLYAEQSGQEELQLEEFR